MDDDDVLLASVMRKLIAAKIVVDAYGPIEGPYAVKVVAGDVEITEDEGHALIRAAGRG